MPCLFFYAKNFHLVHLAKLLINKANNLLVNKANTLIVFKGEQIGVSNKEA